MAYATQTMLNAANRFEQLIASAVCSGIIGDSAHNYGYHRAASEIPSSDYSRQLPGDKNNIDVNAADAVDMSMGRSDMMTVTGRFYHSWKDANDLRLNYFREIIGTLDGMNVIYMDTQSGQQGSSDNSHLWHLHSGGLRVNVNNQHAWNAWISIAVGESWADYCKNHSDDPITHRATPAPTPVPGPPPFPLTYPPNVFGLITGPENFIGGYNARERPTIRVIQQRLIAKGCVPGITNVNSGWADGKFEQPTVDAVKRFQSRNGLQVDGVVGPNTWRKLFS